MDKRFTNNDRFPIAPLQKIFFTTMAILVMSVWMERTEALRINEMHFRYSTHEGGFVFIYKLKKGFNPIETPVNFQWKQFTNVSRAKKRAQTQLRLNARKAEKLVRLSSKQKPLLAGMTDEIAAYGAPLSVQREMRPAMFNSRVCSGVPKDDDDVSTCSDVFYHYLPFNADDQTAVYEIRDVPAESASPAEHLKQQPTVYQSTLKYLAPAKICAVGDLGKHMAHRDHEQRMKAISKAIRDSGCDSILPFGYVGDMAMAFDAGESSNLRVVLDAKFYSALWPALRRMPILMPNDFEIPLRYRKADWEDENGGERGQKFHFMDEEKVQEDLSRTLDDDAEHQMLWRSDKFFSTYLSLTNCYCSERVRVNGNQSKRFNTAGATLVFHSREFYVIKEEEKEEENGKGKKEKKKVDCKLHTAYLMEWLKSVCRLGTDIIIAVEQRVMKNDDEFVEQCGLERCKIPRRELDEALYKRADFVLRGDYDEYEEDDPNAEMDDPAKRDKRKKKPKFYRVLVPNIEKESTDSSFRRTQFIYSSAYNLDSYGTPSAVQLINKLPEGFGFEGHLFGGLMIFSATSNTIQCRSSVGRSAAALKAFKILERLTTSETHDYDKKTGATPENRIPGTGATTFEQITQKIQKKSDPQTLFQELKQKFKKRVFVNRNVNYPDDLHQDGHLANVRRVAETKNNAQKQTLNNWKSYRKGLSDGMAPLMASQSAQSKKATAAAPRRRFMLEDEFEDSSENVPADVSVAGGDVRANFTSKTEISCPSSLLDQPTPTFKTPDTLQRSSGSTLSKTSTTGSKKSGRGILSNLISRRNQSEKGKEREKAASVSRPASVSSTASKRSSNSLSRAPSFNTVLNRSKVGPTGQVPTKNSSSESNSGKSASASSISSSLASGFRNLRKKITTNTSSNDQRVANWLEQSGQPSSSSAMKREPLRQPQFTVPPKKTGAGRFYASDDAKSVASSCNSSKSSLHSVASSSQSVMSGYGGY